MKLQIITDDGDVVGAVDSSDIAKKAPLASTTTLARLITEKAEDDVLHALKLEAGDFEKEDKK